MSDQTQSNNQVIVYALVAIAVLLAVIVGFMVYNNSRSVPAPTVSSTIAPSDSTGANVAAQMPSAPVSVPFDAKTATKLPAGVTPQQALKTYNQDILNKKYDEAYSLLPLAQKTSYGTAAAYGSQVSAYGITGFAVGDPVTTGSDVTIQTTQQTPQMPIAYTWTYTKVGKVWYVKARAMAGVSQ